jgi:hypothetical protein
MKANGPLVRPMQQRLGDTTDGEEPFWDAGLQPHERETIPKRRLRIRNDVQERIRNVVQKTLEFGRTPPFMVAADG